MQLRILLSASGASKSWDLRCRVREALLAFIQKDYADYLPHLRGSFENVARRTGRPAAQVDAAGSELIGGS